MDKLDPPSGAFAETEKAIQANLDKGGAIKIPSPQPTDD